MTRVGQFFAEIGGRALLMHGTEGEVYANPQRCPQLMLIEPAGTRVVVERGEENRDAILPESKDPQVTARWIVQCLAGKVPVPQSIKLQMACCLLAAGKSSPWKPGCSAWRSHFKQKSPSSGGRANKGNNNRVNEGWSISPEGMARVEHNLFDYL